MGLGVADIAQATRILSAFASSSREAMAGSNEPITNRRLGRTPALADSHQGAQRSRNLIETGSPWKDCEGESPKGRLRDAHLLGAPIKGT